jgi:hypothetical protein
MFPVGSPTGSPGAGREARLFDGALLDAGHAGRNTDDNARMRPAVLVHLLDEVPQHLLGHVEVGDHTILEGSDGLDGSGRAAEHPLGLDPHGVDLAGTAVHGHHGGLGEDDPAAANVDQGVRSTEVDRHVAATEAGEVTEEAHGE